MSSLSLYLCYMASTVHRMSEARDDYCMDRWMDEWMMNGWMDEWREKT